VTHVIFARSQSEWPQSEWFQRDVLELELLFRPEPVDALNPVPPAGEICVAVHVSQPPEGAPSPRCERHGDALEAVVRAVEGEALGPTGHSAMFQWAKAYAQRIQHVWLVSGGALEPDDYDLEKQRLAQCGGKKFSAGHISEYVAWIREQQNRDLHRDPAGDLRDALVRLDHAVERANLTEGLQVIVTLQQAAQKLPEGLRDQLGHAKTLEALSTVRGALRVYLKSLDGVEPMQPEAAFALRSWNRFLGQARQRVIGRENEPHLPDVSGSVPLADLDRWVKSFGDIPEGVRVTPLFHDLLNDLVLVAAVARLAEGSSMLSERDTLAEWEPEVARLVAEIPATLNSASEERPRVVMLVEDNPGWQEALADAVRVIAPASKVQRISTAEAAHDAIANWPPREDVVVILDLAIPRNDRDQPSRATGLELLARLRAERPHWPLIVLAAPANSIDDHRTAHAHGVADYLAKSERYAEDIGAALRRALEEVPYVLEFDLPHREIVLDGVRCKVPSQMLDLLWSMTLNAERRTAVAWALELKANATDDLFHQVLGQLEQILVSAFQPVGKWFDMRRLLGTSRGVVTPDGPDETAPTTDYWLRAIWEESPTGKATENRRRFRLHPDRASEPLRVLVIDDEAEWRGRVRDSLEAARYAVTAGDYSQAPSSDGDRTDAVCLDLMDLADGPTPESYAGARWLTKHKDALGDAAVIVLSTVADRDIIRSSLIRHHGVPLSDVISKLSPDWTLRLLRSLYRLERSRVVGEGLVLDAEGWPATVVFRDTAVSVVTGSRSALCFKAAPRRRFIERLARRPFLPVSWTLLYSAAFGDADDDTRGPKDRKNRLASLKNDCCAEITKAVMEERIGQLDASRVIASTSIWGETGYVLNARVIRD
jgi:CheY-like chemotaxis protein